MIRLDARTAYDHCVCGSTDNMHSIGCISFQLNRGQLGSKPDYNIVTLTDDVIEIEEVEVDNSDRN